MRAVWKFSVPIVDDFSLAMPAGAKVLALQWQDRVPCLWALVDPDRRLVGRMCRWIGTGHDMPDAVDAFEYYGTLQVLGAPLVFHLFAQPEG